LSTARAPLGAPRVTPAASRKPRRKSAPALRAFGEPLLWLTSGGLAISLLMIAGLLALVVRQGVATFVALPVVRLELAGGGVAMGEVTREEWFRPDARTVAALPEAAREAAARTIEHADGWSKRRLLRTGNFELTGEHFRWIDDAAVVRETLPPWAVVVERRAWGRFYGEVTGFEVDGAVVTSEPSAAMERLEDTLGEVDERRDERRELETDEIGSRNAELEQARLAVRRAERRHGRTSPEHAAAQGEAAALEERLAESFADIRARIDTLDRENRRYALLLRTADGRDAKLPLADIVRAYAANSLGPAGQASVYLSRWKEFLSDVPREANSEGGVFPAIFGTVAMTLLMSMLVTPFGVLAALYLREYAKGGLVTSAVRIAINNLAGVPSIVFGVFGLGFFCYIVGAGVDALLFADKLPTPTFGTGGILWASLTLALLTLPVVIVATEEALAAVPDSMREGSYACGASKWQTIRRIVLPRALPGILTGMILAIARGAGEVAPLMLVGAVKLAPELPIDGDWPFVHLERSFMHLGFHIYDVGFQSQNSEAAKPMVYTTTLLLITIVASLNLATIWLRARLRRRHVSSQF
jgi:phosphate transport system permease protein